MAMIGDSFRSRERNLRILAVPPAIESYQLSFSHFSIFVLPITYGPIRECVNVNLACPVKGEIGFFALLCGCLTKL